MEYKRRQLIAQPGEHLLLPTTVTGMTQRLEEWLAFSGMDVDDVLISPLCAVPLPLYAGHVPPGRRRWAGVRPEAMWHPLMWLPERVTTPRRLVGPDGVEWAETYDEWVARVALELSESGSYPIDGTDYVRLYNVAGQNSVRPTGAADEYLTSLYDPFTGGWVDVLAIVGIDVDDPAHVARVAAWLGGAPDPALDSIDLDRIIGAVGRDADWAVDRAHGMLDDTERGGSARSYVEDLRDASTALVAHELEQLAGELGDPRRPATLDSVRRDLIALTQVATWGISLADAELEDLSVGLDELTLDAAEAPDLGALRAGPVAGFRTMMDVLAREKVVGIDRLSLRAEVEARAILAEIEEIHSGTKTEEQLLAERHERNLVRPE